MRFRRPLSLHPFFALLIFAALVAAACVPESVHAQGQSQLEALNQPVSPFRIVGNIYYVGASDLTSYLIVTPAGDILLDGGLSTTAPQIEKNIQTLGFKLSDVKILLNSHAHLDHAGGLAELKRLTGAQLVLMTGDAETIAVGGNGSFPPAKADRVIHDGDTVSLGGVTMTAHLTAGHTRGCTTWSTVAKEKSKSYHVVFIGSASVLPNYRLVDRPGSPATYPGIAADYERTFRLLRSLPCDVFLGAHGSFYNLTAKRQAMAAHPAKNPFIDPAGYQAFVAQEDAAFRAVLQRQSAAKTD